MPALHKSPCRSAHAASAGAGLTGVSGPPPNLTFLQSAMKHFFALPKEDKLKASTQLPPLATATSQAPLCFLCVLLPATATVSGAAACCHSRRFRHRSAPAARRPPFSPSQVKRSKDNPLGYLDDEFTKQILDIKECVCGK